MVKIKDLTEKQLLSQLEKYEKIYNQLISERQKRVSAGADINALMTVSEKKAEAERRKKEASSENNSPKPNKTDEPTEAYHLKIDENEISALNQDNNSAPDQEEEEEEVRVTQLLQLSKEQLEELRGGAAKKNEKVDKKKKKKK